MKPLPERNNNNYIVNLDPLKKALILYKGKLTLKNDSRNKEIDFLVLVKICLMVLELLNLLDLNIFSATCLNLLFLLLIGLLVINPIVTADIWLSKPGFLRPVKSNWIFLPFFLSSSLFPSVSVSL